MGTGTRKPWEKFDVNYDRFDAVDPDEAEPAGGEAALSWHQTATAAYVTVVLPAPALPNKVEVAFEASTFTVKVNAASMSLQHPATKHEQSAWTLEGADRINVKLDKSVEEPWDEDTFGTVAKLPAPSKQAAKLEQVATSLANIACTGCGALTKPRCRVVCVCSEVVFCSEACSCESEAHAFDCNGPTTLLDEREYGAKEAGRAAMDLAAHPRAPRMPSCADYEANEPNLLRRHVFDKLGAGAPGGPRWRLANDLAELEACAKAGNNAAAFRAATVLLQTTSRAADSERALAYLRQAADGGCAPAMAPLGLRLCAQAATLREGEAWLWRGARLGCGVARRALHDRCALTEDCRRLHDVACETLRRYPAPDPTKEGMRTAVVDAPDLGSLILALRECLGSHVELAALIGKKKCRAACAGAVEALGALHDRAAADAKVRLVVAYGRARTEAEERQTEKIGTRAKKNRAFLRPVVRPGFDDAFSITAEAKAVAKDATFAKQPAFRLCCRHERKTPRSFCEECLDDASRRLDAVARRAYVLSEAGGAGGRHTVVYEVGGVLHKEPFGAYGLGDVDTALATLAAAEGLPSSNEGRRFPGRDDKAWKGTFVSNRAFLSPLFIASDPNLLWPALYYYGSLANALSRVGIAPPAPGTRAPLTVLAPAVPDGDASILGCGHGPCRKVAARAAMMRCSRCRGRAYCSAACQKADWKVHRNECVECTK